VHYMVEGSGPCQLQRADELAGAEAWNTSSVSGWSKQFLDDPSDEQCIIGISGRQFLDWAYALRLVPHAL
jgi:hypothetical protein